MKRKINTIKGKRLVMGGGTNNLTKDEILVTETSNGIELKERSSDGSIKELAGGSSEGGDNIWKPKDPIYICCTHRNIGSETHFYDTVAMSYLSVANKRKIFALEAVMDGMEFPLYFACDGSRKIEGEILRDYIEHIRLGCPDEGYYITEEQFSKVWNEAE